MHLLGTVAGVAIAGTASLAAAGPEFTVDPATLGGTNTSVKGTDLQGTSSAFINQTTATTQSGQGIVIYNTVIDGLNNVTTAFGLGTGANSYGLYLVFNQTLSYSTGPGGFAADTNYNVSSFTFTLYADPNGADSFGSAATSATGGVAPTITGTGDDIVLATGSLVAGTAGFNSLGGPFENVNATFAICSGVGSALLGATTIADASCANADGKNYFIAPVPFFNLSLSEFNTTSTNVVIDPSGTPPNAAIVSDAGSTDFGTIPEPGTLALIGSGLLGIVFAARRRNKRSV